MIGCESTVAGQCVPNDPGLVVMGVILIVGSVLLLDRWRLEVGD